MKTEVQLLLIFLVLWVLQGLSLYYQNRSIKLKINELRKLGKLFIGLNKKPFSGSIYAFIVIDQNRIKCAKYLRGITIFSKFQEIENMNGLNIIEFQFEIEKGITKGKSKRIFLAFSDALNKWVNLEKGI